MATDSIFIWLFLTFLFIVIQAFFAMQEMAAVSFNKIRLQYLVSKGKKKAVWLDSLLNNPSKLFGTTLIAINLTLQIGSECSRMFYSALGLSPNIAPLTHILFVVIFAELAPMIAARRSSEYISMLGIPIVYFISKVLTPFILGISFISKFANFFIGSSDEKNKVYMINREELQKVFELPSYPNTVNDDSQLIVSNIFSLKDKTAVSVMEPLKTIAMVPSNCTISHMRSLLSKSNRDNLPVYYRSRTNIIGFAFAINLMHAPSHHPVRKYIHNPWFVMEDVNITDIVQQFRHNKQSSAVVLNNSGSAIGILSLNDILDEIFGEKDKLTLADKFLKSKNRYLVERMFFEDIDIKTFDTQFHTNLERYNVDTLFQLFEKNLDHLPQNGDVIRLDQFEFKIEEISPLGIKKISVKTVI